MGGLDSFVCFPRVFVVKKVVAAFLLVRLGGFVVESFELFVVAVELGKYLEMCGIGIGLA